MAALAGNITRDFAPGLPAHWQTLRVADGVIIYAGAGVTADINGRAKPLAQLDVEFLGFADQKVDQTTPVSLGAGALEVRLRAKGEVTAVVAGVNALLNINDTVYMSSDNDFTLVILNNVAVGKVKTVLDISSGLCVVAFEATSERSL